MNLNEQGSLRLSFYTHAVALDISPFPPLTRSPYQLLVYSSKSVAGQLPDFNYFPPLRNTSPFSLHAKTVSSASRISFFCVGRQILSFVASAAGK
jgi:hypothetical protein